MPGFYRYVSAKLSDYDALVINRRTIEKAETADFPLEHFYAQPGSLHPGFDCFAFKRALYSRFSLGQACIGANWIGRIVLVNMMAYAANIWVEKEDHLTFHLGDDRSWKITANIDFGVYPGFPTLFWGLSVFFVGDLMGKALWKLVENAARFPRRGGRVLCVHGAVSFHRARPCGPRWLPGRGAMRHVELDRRVLGLQSTGE